MLSANPEKRNFGRVGTKNLRLKTTRRHISSECDSDINTHPLLDIQCHISLKPYNPTSSNAPAIRIRTPASTTLIVSDRSATTTTSTTTTLTLVQTTFELPKCHQAPCAPFSPFIDTRPMSNHVTEQCLSLLHRHIHPLPTRPDKERMRLRSAHQHLSRHPRLDPWWYVSPVSQCPRQAHLIRGKRLILVQSFTRGTSSVSLKCTPKAWAGRMDGGLHDRYVRGWEDVMGWEMKNGRGLRCNDK